MEKNEAIQNETMPQGVTRINNLVDPNSFAQIGAYALNSNVSAGYATIEGRLVYIYSQYGNVNNAHATLILKVYELALKMGAPVIALLDSKGLNVDEGLETLESYGKIFKIQSEASGVIPQIAVVLGECIGVSSIITSLSDFVFMCDTSLVYLESPNTYTDGANVDVKNYGNSTFHIKESGLAHFTANSEAECYSKLRELISFIPSNNLEDVPANISQDDLNRTDEYLNDLQNNGEFDMELVVGAISDDKYYLEVMKGFTENITAFARINGYSVGIVSINGKLSEKDLVKIGRFCKYCDSYNLAIITVTNINGYVNSSIDDMKLLHNTGKLLSVFSNSSVPKVNIIAGNNVGSSYLTINSKFTGADIVYAWKNATVSIIDKESAKKVLKIDIDNNIKIAASKGHIDDIIEPSNTRKMVAMALEMLASKREPKQYKKHTSIF